MQAESINYILKMFVLLIMIVMSVKATDVCQSDPARDQIINFKKRTTGPIGVLTTGSGAQVPYSEASSTLNEPLIHNAWFMESIAHVNRERIPERIVHSKGSGAFGYFELTHSMSCICNASFLKTVGERTPVAVRFSGNVGERGSNDLIREPKGFAIKFYTEEGNFDIPGFNTPMYTYKDPQIFPALARAIRRNPATHLTDLNTFWDALNNFPEALHLFLIIFADRGIPRSYRHMPGFSLHTYQFINKYGDTSFARFHIMPDGGIKTLSTQEAAKITTTDLDYLIRDLYVEIGKGNYPSWTVYLQILTESDVEEAKINLGLDVFDVTKTIPLDKYPLQQIGKLVLNRNPKNHFADIEPIAFCPGNLVNGIVGAPDKIFESRVLSYRDAQVHRLGVNFDKIPVNCPFRTKTYTYNRDGVPPLNDNGGDTPNYYPNSFNGPIPYKDKIRSRLIRIVEEPANNFDQMGELYINGLTADERNHLIENVAASLGQTYKFLQIRTIEIFTRIHPDFGNRVAQALNSTTTCN